MAVQDSPEDMRAFLSSGPYALPVMVDSTGSVTSAYRIRGVPTVVVIDLAGRIRQVHVGLTSASQLVEMVARER